MFWALIPLRQIFERDEILVPLTERLRPHQAHCRICVRTFHLAAIRPLSVSK
jgi:hypothetical protein